METKSRRNFFRQLGGVAAAPVIGVAAAVGFEAPKPVVRPFENGELLTCDRLNEALGLAVKR